MVERRSFHFGVISACCQKLLLLVSGRVKVSTLNFYYDIPKSLKVSQWLNENFEHPK